MSSQAVRICLHSKLRSLLTVLGTDHFYHDNVVSIETVVNLVRNLVILKGLGLETTGRGSAIC